MFRCTSVQPAIQENPRSLKNDDMKPSFLPSLSYNHTTRDSQNTNYRVTPASNLTNANQNWICRPPGSGGGVLRPRSHLGKLCQGTPTGRVRKGRVSQAPVRVYRPLPARPTRTPASRLLPQPPGRLSGYKVKPFDSRFICLCCITAQTFTWRRRASQSESQSCRERWFDLFLLLLTGSHGESGDKWAMFTSISTTRITHQLRLFL